MLAAHLFEAREFGKRIGVVVDAQIELRPLVVAVDQERRRLLAALVAAGGLAGSHRRDQPLREWQVFARDIARGRIVQHPGAGQHVAGDREAGVLDVPAPVDAFASGMGGDAAAGIHDVELPAGAAAVGGDQARDDVARARAPARSSFRPSMP